MSPERKYHFSLARTISTAAERGRRQRKALTELLKTACSKLEEDKLAIAVIVSDTLVGACARMRSRRHPQRILVTEIKQSPHNQENLITRITSITPERTLQVWPEETALLEEAQDGGSEEIPGEISRRNLIELLRDELSTPDQESEEEF